jgi:hypothetical protein
MAGKQAVFTLKVDTGNSVNDINNFDKSLQGLNKDIDQTQQNLTDSTATDMFAQKLQELNSKVDAGGLTMRELGKVVREYQSIAMATGETSPVGSEALLKASKLTDKMGDIRKQTTAMSSDFVKLDTAIQGIETGAAVFQGVQSAIALTGVENEKLMQTMVKLQAVQGVANSVNTIAKNLNSESVLGLQLKTAWEKIYAVAVGNSTGAMKGLRVAMLSTGIGALIIGIGALIANWDKLKNSISNQTSTQKISNQVMKTATAQIANELSASDKLSRQLRDETLTRQQKIQKVKEFQVAYPGLLKNVNLETMSIAQINGQLIKNIELLKLQAQAKAIEAVRAEKLQEILTTQLDIQSEAQENAGNFTIDLGSNAKNGWIGYSTGAENAKLATMDFTKIQTTETKNLKTQIGALDKAGDAIDKQIALLKQQGASVSDGTDKIVDYSKQTKSFTSSTNDSSDAVEKQNKINERKAEILDDISKAQQEFNDSQLTQQEKEIAEVQRKYKTLIDEAKEYNSLLTEAEKEKAINITNIEIAQMNQENDINLKYQAEQYAKTKADEEKKLKDIAEAEKKKLDLYQQYRAIVEDEYQQEITAFEKAQEEKVKALNSNLAEGNISQEEYFKTMLQLEEDYDKKIVDVNKKKNKDIADAEKKSFDDRIEKANKMIQGAQNALNELKKVNDTIKMFEQIRIDESKQKAEQQTLILDEQQKKELSNQNLTEQQKTAIQESYAKKKYEIQLKQFNEEEKIKQSQFKRDKALRIAQIAIDTASAIVKGIATFGPPPSPMGIASIAFASALGIAQASAVAKQQYQGGSAPSAPNVSAGGGMGASSFQVGTNTQQTTNPQPQQTTNTSTAPISVVVVESDITNVQNKVKAQELKSNFG